MLTSCLFFILNESLKIALFQSVQSKTYFYHKQHFKQTLTYHPIKSCHFFKNIYFPKSSVNKMRCVHFFGLVRIFLFRHVQRFPENTSHTFSHHEGKIHFSSIMRKLKTQRSPDFWERVFSILAPFMKKGISRWVFFDCERASRCV